MWARTVNKNRNLISFDWGYVNRDGLPRAAYLCLVWLVVNVAAAPEDRRLSPTALPVAPPVSILFPHSWAHFHYPWPTPGRPQNLRRALKPNCFCHLRRFPRFSDKDEWRERERDLYIFNQLQIRTPQQLQYREGSGSMFSGIARPETQTVSKYWQLSSLCLQSSSDDYTTRVVEK